MGRALSLLQLIVFLVTPVKWHFPLVLAHTSLILGQETHSSSTACNTSDFKHICLGRLLNGVWKVIYYWKLFLFVYSPSFPNCATLFCMVACLCCTRTKYSLKPLGIWGELFPFPILLENQQKQTFNGMNSITTYLSRHLNPTMIIYLWTR